MKSKAQIRANYKWESKRYYKYQIRLPIAEKDEWMKAREREGKSINDFILSAVREHLRKTK